MCDRSLNLSVCDYETKVLRLKHTPYTSVSLTLWLADPFLLRKTTTDPHILVHVNIRQSGRQLSKIKNLHDMTRHDIYLLQLGFHVVAVVGGLVQK